MLEAPRGQGSLAFPRALWLLTHRVVHLGSLLLP